DRTRADTHDGPEHKGSNQRPDTLMQDRHSPQTRKSLLATHGRTIHMGHLRPRRSKPPGHNAAHGFARVYPITSSARPSNGSGTLMPSALAALRLRNISTFVDC